MPQPTRITLAQAVRQYRERKLAIELADDWFYLVYRVFSLALTPPLARLGIAPSAVTLMGLLIALSLPWLAWSAGWAALAAAAFVFSVCDALDGDLARAYGQGSRFGAWLDANTDLMYRACVYLGIGLLAWREQAGMLCVLTLVALVLMQLARMLRMQAAAAPAADGAAAGTGLPTSAAGLVFAFIASIDHALPVLIALAGASGHVDWLIGWLAIYGLADYLHAVISGARSFRES